MRNKLLKFSCILFFLILIISSQLALPLLGREEAFPLFTWNLYSFPSKDLTYFSVRIIEVNGRPFENTDVLDAPDHFSPRIPRMLNPQIQLLGQALTEGEIEYSTAKKRIQLEKNIFYRYNRVEYEVTRRQIAVVEFLKDPSRFPATSIKRFLYDSQN